MAINFAQEVLDRCDTLALHSESKENITRRFLTAPMRQVHRLVTSWMEEVGLSVRVDNIGNIIGSYIYKKNSPTLIIGSHLDTVVNAGKYDGILGFLLPLSLLKILQKKNITLKHNIEVIGFSDEEGSRYRKNFLGSLGRIGRFPLEYLQELDQDGISMKEAIENFGLTPTKINQTSKFQKGDLFLEIHTEQGFVLQNSGVSLGIVNGIVGQTHWMMEFAGKANHAGTCLMGDRQDALVCASKAILYITKEACSQDGLVATCGEIVNYPNSVNIISDKTLLTLDVRHYNNEIREQFLIKTAKHLQKLANDSNVGFKKSILGTKNTVECSAQVKKLLSQSFKNQNIEPYYLNSGAGHDAMIMASSMPAAMLFVRSPNGVSHHPSELVYLADIEKALKVLTDFLCCL